MPNHVLLAVDDSPASDKVVEYVGNLLHIHPGGRRRTDQARVSIVHCYQKRHVVEYATSAILAPDMKFEAYQARLAPRDDMAANMLRVRRTSDAARERLVELGVPRSVIDIYHVPFEAGTDVPGRILATARELKCDTIAVGRNEESDSWFNLRTTHTSDILLRSCQGLVVWVVQ